jgi:hypothetical protein
MSTWLSVLEICRQSEELKDTIPYVLA